MVCCNLAGRQLRGYPVRDWEVPEQNEHPSNCTFADGGDVTLEGILCYLEFAMSSMGNFSRNTMKYSFLKYRKPEFKFPGPAH